MNSEESLSTNNSNNQEIINSELKQESIKSYQNQDKQKYEDSKNKNSNLIINNNIQIVFFPIFKKIMKK